MRRRWLCALVALGSGALGVSLHAPASAAELPAGWRAVPRLPEALTASAGVQRTVRLRSQPMTATFDGVDYRMSYVAEHTPAAPGGAESFLDVVLSRSVAVRHGRARQTNQYSFQPATPFTFTWRHGSLATAQLDTGGALSPDILQARFTATSSVVERPCRGLSGGTSVVRRATGDIVYPAFSIDTGTAPFFGTLTGAAPTGTLEVDQGCSAPAAPSSSRQCLGRQQLTAFHNNQFWTFGSRYVGTTRTQGHLDFGSFLDSPVRIRFMSSPSPLATFPKAVHTRSGATVHVNGVGNPFMGGSATFRSSRRPQTSGPHVCLSHGRMHRFHTLHYDGRLVPDAAPLTVKYDTGDAVLRAGSAELLLRVYGS